MKFDTKYLTYRGKLAYKILKKLYLKNSLTRKLFYQYINRYEGGQFYSTTLRRIFKETRNIDVQIGSYGCFTDGFRPNVTIGAYCSIASGVQRLVGNHPYDNISTYPLFYKKDFGALTETRYDEKQLSIGHDVWIGVNAIITGNVQNIGNGAIIGAGAVVTHDVEPYTIVAGVPARKIGVRFSDSIQEQLEKSKWWELTPDELAPMAELANQPEAFIKKVTEKVRDTRE
ncbi:CatB-related O-acetyltransferase [Streptococcus thoraltensis]|uniref:CatB-related O-acetyltransferase n=1 Tax=Streptococcus thoraltensis TaxID=55085 RepID=UPI001F583792|nr:CatB-related O-acetyltransferase [Streptococcus thoraltensis]